MAAADRARVERALRQPPADIRLFLLHGPDESGSRSLAALLAEALGQEATRVDLSPQALRQDGALLATEAASSSLFGEPRHIRVEGAGEDCLAAVEALLEAEAAGNPVVMIAGTLRKDSRLLKLASGHAAAIQFASYPPTAASAEAVVAELAREIGLLLDPDEVRRITSAAGGDRAIAASEIVKLATFADVAPDRPAGLPEDAIALLGADNQEGSLGRLADLVADGQPRELEAELARLAGEGIEGIAALRPVLRRTLQIATARAAVESRDVKPFFGGPPGERERVTRQAGHWRPARIAAALARLLAAERAIKAPGGSTLHADEALLAIARGASRDR